MIRIATELMREIRAHGAAAYPDECCGALLGADGPPATEDSSGRVVHGLCPIDNRWNTASLRGEEAGGMTARRRFLITPEDYRRCESAAGERGLELIGFYHSHPDHPARPSEYDREHAFPWFSYVIVSVERGNATTATSWLLAEDLSRFDEEPIIETDGPAPIASA